MSITILFLTVALLFLILFFYFCRILTHFLSEQFAISNFFRDMRLDWMFEKAVVISYQIAQKEKIEAHKIEEYTTDKTVSIVTDVLLQNGLDPKNYALYNLAYFYKHKHRNQIPRFGNLNKQQPVSH